MNLSDLDIYLLREGNHNRLYEKLGSHLSERDGKKGVRFSVWAPNAASVSVVGNFNGWNEGSHPLNVRWDGSGIWECFVPGIGQGEVYKYRIISSENDYKVLKGDPYAFKWEEPPRTGSVVWNLEYDWEDADWMEERPERNSLEAPISVYEMHAGSWKRVPGEGNRSLTYRELALELPGYLHEAGFTHVEFLPVMEHPFYGSWGYQTTGYFAPTSRYGTPQDLMYLIDCLHRNGIGVIMDWVPSHFPGDEHGLVYFDGTHLYEHSDPRQGYHPDWNSYIFNYGRVEVRSFLKSSAQFWFDKYHIDAIRVDAVASMIYLDYSRKEGEWIPNIYGGRENLEAISFLKELNASLYSSNRGIQTIAEESTAWPMVSRPVDVGGLGFGMKWNMGWMNDTLEYFREDPVHRKYHHGKLTFSMVYAFNENFVLSLSHDEVVYGKGSLIDKMPGDAWQKAANLRALFGYMFGHPGKKLVFMGAEFGQWDEWSHEKSLDWHLLGSPLQGGIYKWVCDLNEFYRGERALHEVDFSQEGFEWLVLDDAENSAVSFVRKARDGAPVIVVCNFTPVVRTNYGLRVPCEGFWRECLNSDAVVYGGSGVGNGGGVQTLRSETVDGGHRMEITLPPLGTLYFKFED